MIKPEEWEWFGNAGHYICASRCRFHLCTRVGKYLVSTVGEMLDPNGAMEDIGYQRKFETYVFKIKGFCKEKGCSCGMPEFEGSEIEGIGCNSRKQANVNHGKMCRKYAEELK